MSDSYTLTATFEKHPGWEKAPVHVEAELPIVVAALKQLCEYPTTSLHTLDRLEVKRS